MRLPSSRWLLLWLAGMVAVLAGCPAAHPNYDTSRKCDETRDCTENEVCARWDAGTDGGFAHKLCYNRDEVVLCEFPDAHVYYCFEPNLTCLYREGDAGAPGCAP